MQSWRWKYDRLWAVLEYIESVRWIDLYVDCKASSIQFDHRQTAKKQTIKYDNNKRLMSNLGLFSRANHAICTFKYRSDIINGMQMMQSVFLCMGNPYARPDASGYHRRMVVYKCALTVKTSSPCQGSRIAKRDWGVVISPSVTYRWHLPRQREVESSCCKLLRLFENHPFESSSSREGFFFGKVWKTPFTE